MKITAFFGGIFAALLIVVHAKTAHADKIMYFNNGTQTEVSLTKLPQIMSIIKDMAQSTDDVYKLIVTPEYIDEVKTQKQGIEISFQQDYELTIPQGQINVQKILLPFCEAPAENCLAVMYFGGRKSYWTPPYVNTNGARHLQKIQQIITQ